MAVDVEFLNGNNVNNINNNFQRVKNALQEVIGRNGNLPNHMNADLDMNSNDILNVDGIDLQRIVVDGEEFDPRQMRGWAPVFSAVEYNGTVVMKLIDYVGGYGIKPTQYIGWYIGSTGYVQDINQATGFGSSGVTDGDKGDITVSNSGSVWDLNKNFDTVSELLSDESIGYLGSGSPTTVSDGDIVTAQGFQYEVAASGATDAHVETAGGVKLYVLPGDQGFAVAAFGDMAADAYGAFNKAPDGAFVDPGTYPLSQSIFNKSFWSTGPVQFTGAGRALVVDVLHEFNAGFAAVESGPYNSNGTDIYYSSGPSLVATPSGRIFVFYSMGATHTGSSVTGPLCYREFNRHTKLWGPRKVLAEHEGFQCRNQAAGITPTGRIWVDYCVVEYSDESVLNPATRSTRYKYTDDDTDTWSEEKNLSQYCPYPSLDNVPYGGVTSFANGDLLITLYNFHTIITLRSTDNGATWGNAWGGGALPNANPHVVTVYTDPTWAADNITEPTIIKIDETRLIMVCRSIHTGRVNDGTAVLRFRGRRWAANTRYEADMYVSVSAFNGSRVYKVTGAGAGTSGATEPTHTSGTATNGTVTFEYMGTWSAWAASTPVLAGAYVETYSSYLYEVVTAGTTGTTAPFYAKYEGNEPQFGIIKSDNGGVSWGSRQYVTWASVDYRATTSPPRGIVKGGMVDLMWFTRSPDYTLYHVRMSAIAFFYRPEWGFSAAEGNPKGKLFRSFLASDANPWVWRIDEGYVDLAYVPWDEDQIMYSWYDKPALGVTGRTTVYSSVLRT